MTPRAHLATLLGDMARLGAQSAVVEHRGVRRHLTTYAQLTRGACWFAMELTRRGIEPGDRIVLWGENSAAWIACFFGCVLRGVLVVPLDASGGASFAERIVGETTPRLLAGDPILLQAMPSTAQFSLATLSHAMQDASVPTTPWEALVTGGLGPDTPLQILFTSGTTGDPKGIVHTHRNLLASLTPIEQEIAKYRRYERVVHPLHLLHTLPLSHVFGQFMGLWIAPVLGLVVHYESRLEAGRLLGLLGRERISILAAVPRVLSLLRADLISCDPGLPQQLRHFAQERIWKRWWRFRRVHRRVGFRFWAIVCGGATLPAELEEFWTTLGIALIQGYGMTETSALVTLNHPFKPARGTLGAALPGRELRLTSAGELLVRGEMVATTAWREGRLQPAAVSNKAGEGWLATGDLARRDEQGRLHYMGRTSQRMVTAAGLNVYLEDVEAALASQPHIRAAVALGIEGPFGPEPAAVLLADTPVSAADAIVLANANLGPHQRVVRWWLWPGFDLPRTATGKVRRSAIEAWVAERILEDAAADSPPHASAPQPSAPDALLQMIASVTGRAGMLAHGAIQDPNASLESLGLDSLARVQLQTALERALGRALDDAAIAEVRTLADLRSLAGIAVHPVPPVAGHPHQPIGLPEAEAFAEPARHSASEQPHFLFVRWSWSAPVQLLRTLFVELCVRPIVWLLAAPRVRRSAPGLRTQPTTPMLIVANHLSSYDVPLLLYALPPSMRRRVAAAAAGEMLEDWRHARRNPVGPVIYWLVTLLFNAFPLPRSHAFRAAFAHAGEALDRGYSILIFPEGTRSHGGPMQSFRGGTGLLALEAAVPVLPVALLESRAPRGLRPYQATIHIGELLTIDPREDPQAVTKRLEQAVRSLISKSD